MDKTLELKLRNLIVHNYSEQFSSQIAQEIVNKYYNLINIVYKKINVPNT